MTMTRRNDPQLRVCIGCAREWYSAAHYSREPAYCEICGSPLVETLVAFVEAIRNQNGRSSHTRVQSPP